MAERMFEVHDVTGSNPVNDTENGKGPLVDERYTILCPNSHSGNTQLSGVAGIPQGYLDVASAQDLVGITHNAL